MSDNITASASSERPTWWRHGVVYQLYVRSYTDANGDGIGDLGGVAARLDHIATLGVDGVWLNPCYPSPNRDGGYDVADYTVIDERYGGMPAFEALRDAAHARGLKLLMDLVPNHCSTEHDWFRRAVAAGPGADERGRFIFRDGRGAGGSQPPNNWRSTFGGPAWTRLTGPDGEPEQWYLHSFDAGQPDFDWSNPEVADMFDDVLRTWFDRGVDGFRIDVAYAMVKHPDLPDLDDPAGENPYSWNQPGVHDIFRRWRALADAYERELALVGEVWLPPAEAADYIRPGELHQVFNFDLLQQEFDARAFRASITDCLDALKHVEGVPAWTLNSHDVHRAVTRYGLTDPEPPATADLNALRTRARGVVDVQLGTERAKAALLLMLALPGTAYLYQGEELGLPEVQDLPDEARRDPIWERSGHTEHGRDGSRVPLPWRADAPDFGFSLGPDHPEHAQHTEAEPPWLPQPAWFADYSADRQESDPRSVLAFYRRALRERRNLDPDAPLAWLEIQRDDAIAFRRGDYVCVTVFDGPPIDALPQWGPAVISSGTAGDTRTTTWYCTAPAE
ncbi:MAG TPA: glycoside hydrolase family 13 protein [Actinocrinis sp.]|uniref:glycoside hydrolase family 13 protein n=1 Tax=Actinocrinis sp. TaxID=1920516 RepID=UPI002DDD450B|nr:glycoside hydrolase family 13 protein [Actinocrinis sp.]HEV2345998.1 glycoside hydrolase family 13 protein [Actinocrinis sp.]